LRAQEVFSLGAGRAFERTPPERDTYMVAQYLLGSYLCLQCTRRAAPDPATETEDASDFFDVASDWGWLGCVFGIADHHHGSE
jgi:hypothetical protein